MRYRTGQSIPTSGIYRVEHQQHRAPHEVTLLRGEEFPRCARCGDRVEFELVKAAPDLANRPFAIHLYEIPDLDTDLPEPVSPQ
jgi:hypothetical protein